MDVILYRLSIPFAIVTATGAGILAALSWNVLRESPFGTTLKLLALVMSIVTVYHGGLLITGAETPALQFLLILGYVLVLLSLVIGGSELNRDRWTTGEFRHQNVLPMMLLGVFLYAVVGPLSELLFPSILHWVHGVAALFAVAGMYSPVQEDLRRRPWNELLFTDATKGRQPAEWMVPLDNEILEVLYSSELVLTPAVIAHNLSYSREEVNRRLTRLESERLVERVQRGKYRLADRGERYVNGHGVSV